LLNEFIVEYNVDDDMFSNPKPESIACFSV
jgi:hypothetical protein